MKKKSIYFGGITFLLLALLGYLNRDNITRFATKMTLDKSLTGSGIQATEYNDDRRLIGASHNVFVGRVKQQVGDKKRQNGPPETQFSVEVITNIKGNLAGSVIIDQFGSGYWGGVLYAGGTIAPENAKTEDVLLQTGWSYIFAARYNDVENWYTISVPPYDRIVLNKNADIDGASLKRSAEENGNVRVLKKVYAEEILLDADVAHGHAWNSYASRHYDASGQLIDDTAELAQQHSNAPKEVLAPSSVPGSSTESESVEATSAASESVEFSASAEPITSPIVTSPAESNSPSPAVESTPTPTDELPAPTPSSSEEATAPTPFPTEAP